MSAPAPVCFDGTDEGAAAFVGRFLQEVAVSILSQPDPVAKALLSFDAARAFRAGIITLDPAPGGGLCVCCVGGSEEWENGNFSATRCHDCRYTSNGLF